MTETDPVAYLRNRHARAEQLARACPPGQSLLPEPDGVLARVKAERELLVEHAVHECGDREWCALEPKHQRAFCNACRPGMFWPCRTVRLLAAGWGWTEDA